jgi:mono/diheme cytochrome c family protein
MLGRAARVALVVGATLSLLSLESPRGAIAQPTCVFTLGFKALHDQIPDLVGDCLENEHFNVQNGNAEQRTKGGLLVWRKADNWTAFTNGATTWINGPDGLASRPNAGPLFPWEAATPPQPAPAQPAATPPSQPAATPAPQPAGTTASGAAGPNASQIQAGSQVFAQVCASCHGANGEGKIGPRLIGGPTTFQSWADAQELYGTVKAEMPLNAPGSLTDQQYWNVVAFLLDKDGLNPRGVVLGPDTASQIKLR